MERKLERTKKQKCGKRKSEKGGTRKLKVEKN